MLKAEKADATPQQYYQQQRITNSGLLPAGRAAVAGADSAAGEEAAGQTGARGFPEGCARSRLHGFSERR